VISPATKKGFHAGREPANKGNKFPPEVLSEAEVRGLIEACSNKAPTGIRNRALIIVMYRGGLRAGETLALRPKDVDVSDGTITVLHGKGDRRRVVGLDPGAMAILIRWLDMRRTLGITGHAPLLCTLDGNPLKPSYVRTLLPRLARKVGIEKRVHPHGLRHTHAYELMMEGVPVPIIQQQLGHTSLATTDRYVAHLAPRDLINRMQAREWSVETG
jgi:integrase